MRGTGLAIGVEIVADGTSKRPDAALAGAIRDGMRERGVLIGTAGAHGNVLKIRPPLAFTAADVPVVSAALDATLAALSTR